MNHARITAGLASILVACSGVAAQLDHPAPQSDPAAPKQPAAPRVIQPASPATPAPAKKPAKDPIYDEAADARQQIAAAVAKAKKENRRVLIQWGGNWCGWCHLLHNTLESDRNLKRELQYEYDVVLVDAGRENKNADLAEKLGAKIDGYPFLTVLDADGKPVAHQGTEPLELKGPDGKSLSGKEAGHDPAKVMEFLKANEAPRVEAVAAFKQGLEKAKGSGKLVFLHFGAPWCGWCHRLEDWMAREDIAPLLAKDFVDVKIDQDRMPGGKDLFARYNPKPGGIPWFAFIDPESGKAVITSDGPKGNVGFPAAPEEVEHFVEMLKKSAKKLTPADIEKIQASLAQPKKST